MAEGPRTPITVTGSAAVTAVTKASRRLRAGGARIGSYRDSFTALFVSGDFGSPRRSLTFGRVIITRVAVFFLLFLFFFIESVRSTRESPRLSADQPRRADLVTGNRGAPGVKSGSVKSRRSFPRAATRIARRAFRIRRKRDARYRVIIAPDAEDHLMPARLPSFV